MTRYIGHLWLPPTCFWLRCWHLLGHLINDIGIARLGRYEIRGNTCWPGFFSSRKNRKDPWGGCKMNNYRISLACRDYDRTDAIIRGLVKLPDFDLKVFQIDHVQNLFTRMFKGEFDVSEFSFAEFVYYTSREKCDFIAIPVFPSRIFRHGYIFSNSKIERPEQLDGK